jgi:predicted PurR-regulated permease PerM
MDAMKMNRTVYFLAALLVLCLALSYQMAQPFLGPAMLALLFAIAFQPLHLWIARFSFFHHRESLAALIATLLIYFLVLLPLGIAVALLADDAVAQVAAINTASKTEGGLTPLLTAKVHAVVAWVAPRLRLSEDYLMSQITSRAQAVTQAGLSWLGGFVVSAGSSLLTFFLAAIMLFFFLRDGARIRQALIDLTPLPVDDSVELLAVVNDTIKANLYGVVGVAMVQGLLTTIGLFFARVPSALTWGALATLAAFIPFVGPTLVWVPAVLWLLSGGHYGSAVFLTIWGVVVVGLADNILRPALVGGKTHQHALLVFLSLLGGTAAFGVMGLFLGPLLVSVTIAVFKVLRREMAS